MMIKATICLTGSGCFTDESDQVVLDLGKGVIVIHDEHVPLAGFAADDPQLCHVHVGHSHYKHAVACGDKKIHQSSGKVITCLLIHYFADCVSVWKCTELSSKSWQSEKSDILMRF